MILSFKLPVADRDALCSVADVAGAYRALEQSGIPEFTRDFESVSFDEVTVSSGTANDSTDHFTTINTLKKSIFVWFSTTIGSPSNPHVFPRETPF
jgi:hypothetical protein